MRTPVHIEIRGCKELEQRLQTLKSRVANRVAAAALGKACTPIVRSAKQLSRRPMTASGRRYGGLSKSLGKVVRKYHATQKILAVIGPLRGKAYQREGKKEVPANIAHLVEFGHRVASGGTLAGKSGSKRRAYKSRRTGIAGGGRQTGFVVGQPFLRPAFDSQRAAAQATLERELRAGIEKAASK